MVNSVEYFMLWVENLNVQIFRNKHICCTFDNLHVLMHDHYEVALSVQMLCLIFQIISMEKVNNNWNK